jgi:hypothetical protein
MELRLAFGPGTRLWALRSREELCYDWLHFKSMSENADFRDFAAILFANERAHAVDPESLREVGRRINVVLKAHRIQRHGRSMPINAACSQPADKWSLHGGRGWADSDLAGAPAASRLRENRHYRPLNISAGSLADPRAINEAC